MTPQVDEKDAIRTEEQSLAAEMMIEKEDSRKDLKEKRGVTKQTFYDGSKKLKHIVPKGKRI